jgi:hypothetical protein
VVFGVTCGFGFGPPGQVPLPGTKTVRRPAPATVFVVGSITVNTTWASPFETVSSDGKGDVTTVDEVGVTFDVRALVPFSE